MSSLPRVDVIGRLSPLEEVLEKLDKFERIVEITLDSRD
jgi:hypothetical protein